MAYARWLDGPLYVYASVDGDVTCIADHGDGDWFNTIHLHTLAEVLAHMREHADRDPEVPEHLLDPLTYDDDAELPDGDGIHAEIELLVRRQMERWKPLLDRLAEGPKE
jgi:hypothetical protein